MLSELERRGDFRESPVRPRDPTTGLPFADGVIPSSRLSPISQNVLQLVPLPNAGRTQLISVQDGILDADQFLIRADHWFNPTQSLQVRYFCQKSDIGKPFSFPPPVNVPGFSYTDDATVQNALAAYTQNITPALLLESRLIYARFDSRNNRPAFEHEPAALGFRYPFTGPQNIPTLILPGLTTIGSSTSTDAVRRDNRYQLQNHLSWTRGRNSLKAGVEVWENRFSLIEDASVFGSFTFTGGVAGSAAADFVLGVPSRFTQGKAGAAAYFRSPFWQFYFQNDLRVSRRLTLNLGVRCELNQVPREQQDRIVAFRPGA